MGANSQQGWALLLFILGFTFLPAGLFALGPMFSVLGLVMLIASVALFSKIKPLEYANETKKLEPVSTASTAKHAAVSTSH
jgi:membrane-bound ClpP family serine protease